jgi:hypothetical protein
MTTPTNYARICRLNETGFRLVLSPNPDPTFGDVEVHGHMHGDTPRLSASCVEGNFSAHSARSFASRMVIAADLINRLGHDLPTGDELRAALVAVAPEIDLY